MSTVAVAVSVPTQGYRDRFVMARLDDMTRPIYVQVRSLARGQASITEVWTNLQEQAQKNDVYILLVDGAVERFGRVDVLVNKQEVFT